MIKKLLIEFYKVLEGMGRARAASVLVQQHRYEEARNLMIGANK